MSTVIEKAHMNLSYISIANDNEIERLINQALTDMLADMDNTMKDPTEARKVKIELTLERDKNNQNKITVDNKITPVPAVYWKPRVRETVVPGQASLEFEEDHKE